MKLKNWQVQASGLVLLGLLFVFSIPYFSERISASLQTSTQQALQSKGQQWASVKMYGRNAVVAGIAPSTNDYHTTLGTIQNVTGIRRVQNDITNRSVSPYTFSLNWDNNQLTVDGFLATQEAYDEFLKAAHETFGKEVVSGQVQLASGEPKNWNSMLKTTLMQMKKMRIGNAQISDQAIYLSGQVDTTHGRNQIAANMSRLKKAHYQPSLHIQPADAAQSICQQRFNKLLGKQTIQFGSGSADILLVNQSLLVELGKTAALCPDAVLTIVGHTDNAGDAEANKRLSQQRAKTVVTALFQQGIALDRLKAVGYGEQKPIADNRTDDGKRQNRRIEFIVGEQ